VRLLVSIWDRTGTFVPIQDSKTLYLIEIVGGADGTRTRDLLRDRQIPQFLPKPLQIKNNDIRSRFQVLRTLSLSAVKCSRSMQYTKVIGTVLGPTASISFREIERPDSERLSNTIGQISRNINSIDQISRHQRHQLGGNSGEDKHRG
jgi:hypothetical protein